jgi:predicted dehydrogenase
MWLFGEIASVTATIKNFAGHKGVEDCASVQIAFDGGCTGQLTSIWHNVLSRESNRYMEIFFENGFISTSHDFIGPVNYQTGKGDLETITAEEVLDAYLSSAGMRGPRYNSLHSMQGLQNYHFLKALDAGDNPQPDFGVAVKAHEVVEAIYKSGRTNEEVTLPLS